MEGSSESGWQRSESSRGLNSSLFGDRNLRLLHGSSIRSSSNASLDSGIIPARKGRTGFSEDGLAPGRVVSGLDGREVSLRKWLDNPERTVDALECLHIFTQIVEIVNMAHSQGIVVHNVRPSCFVMSSFNRVAFIESASCSNSSSDSLEDGLNSQTAQLQPGRNPTNPSPIASETICQQQQSGHAMPCSDGNKNQQTEGAEEEKKHPFPMKQILLLETNWYTSPEEVAGAPSSCASDIYRLGVLLFELFCTFSSQEEKSTTMSSLRHRVLPPQLLLKWPKEASFCLWLLHPEPSSRPNLGYLHSHTLFTNNNSELLQSEFLNNPRENFEDREAAIELREKIDEQELLLEFLLLTQQRKEEAADNLKETISFLSSDIEEVTNMQTALRKKGGSNMEVGKDPASNRTNKTDDDDSGNSGSRKRSRPGICTCNLEESGDHPDKYQISKTGVENQGSFLSKSSRLMKNFKKLESAYYLMRRRAVKPTDKPSNRHSQISSDGRGSIVATERSSVSNLSSKPNSDKETPSGWINSFLEGLCKYLSFSKLEVKADLKQGDLLNSSNLVCSLSFDRDGEFFASAGVNKKIKIFEYNSILNEDHDIHYPVVEMASRSKLSSICWNSYIKSQIASSNFEGVVQVWDVSRSQLFMEMREHERRVWSVDFSVADPTMLASGSDDGSVKLWNINQGVSVGTITTKANVCCVQFPFDSGHSLAFGSADHRIYYYDLRNAKMPLYTLIGHNKTVSYVKFIDSTTLVSASTDNTIKLWDLSMCSSRILDCPLQSYTGHMNVKNFVGLSVSEGFIATGSETNEVFIYHKAFPMPAFVSNKFTSTDPLSGDVVEDAAQFISSVCWHGKSSTLVAANSMGNIKLLEMV
nr:protein SPA1-RELATED 4-like isoform X1 [Ipomoea batatas]